MKKRVVEEFEEFDYSDLFDDLSASSVTSGQNVTEYEVRLSRSCSFMCAPSVRSGPPSFVFVRFEQIVEYEDYDNATHLHHANEYEYEDEYDERYGPAEREREYSLNTQVQLEL